MCATEGIAWRLEPFPGECTEAAVEALVAATRAWAPEMVVAAGGGKALDTGKLLAEALGVPAVMVPTIVATDAPTSRVAVLYTEEHAQLRVVRLRASPALVVVDSAIIVRAPVRFLVAGMGDAIATWPEARTCGAKPGRTPAGGRPSRAALALAELCYQTVLTHGRQARADAAAGRVTEAVEAVVEANTLLSGLGFESGGLAAAHSLYAGLSLLPAGSAFLHGEKVAFGVIVQTVLEAWPAEERKTLLDFYRDVGLPATLREIGLGEATAADLRRAAEVGVSARIAYAQPGTPDRCRGVDQRTGEPARVIPAEDHGYPRRAPGQGPRQIRSRPRARPERTDRPFGRARIARPGRDH